MNVLLYHLYNCVTKYCTDKHIYLSLCTLKITVTIIVIPFPLSWPSFTLQTKYYQKIKIESFPLSLLFFTYWFSICFSQVFFSLSLSVNIFFSLSFSVNLVLCLLFPANRSLYDDKTANVGVPGRHTVAGLSTAHLLSGQWYNYIYMHPLSSYQSTSSTIPYLSSPVSPHSPLPPQ